ncbi:TPA: hypothetical protein ACG0A7_002557 [Enterobacter roggenkampii]
MDESRNNMREEFESWLAPSWSRDTYLEDEGEVVYVDDWVQGAWVGWRASRAAIEIDLPRRKMACASGYGDGYLVDSLMGDALEYDETVDAIRAAGIKVKE